MPDKSEKEKRKQIMKDLNKKAEQAFESSLPISRDSLRKLFDYLDTALTINSCDNTHCLAKNFLLQAKIENIAEVLDWLANHGGYCDCEVLANIEEQFE